MRIAEVTAKPRKSTALAIEGGVETSHHFINASLTDTKLDYCAISADGTNAFNSRERSKMLSALFEHESLEPLWRLAHWSYSSDTPLWARDDAGNVVYYLISSNGSRQGCALGMILYCISMKEIFTETVKSNSNIHAVAVADDFYIIAPPTTLSQHIRSSRSSARKTDQ